MFLIALNSKDIPAWHSIIDKYYNTHIYGLKWQKYILTQLDFLKTTKFTFDIEEVLAYLKLKEQEIESYNIKNSENIKSVTIGNQVWMSEDLKFIPKDIDYIFYPRDTLISLSKTSINIKIDDLGRNKNFYKINVENDKGYKNIYVSSKIINLSSNPQYHVNSRIEKLCPLGWRLPTEKDLDILNNTLGGDKSASDNMILAGGGVGFDLVDEINFIYWNTKANSPYMFYGFQKTNFEEDAKYCKSWLKLPSYSKCRCIKE
jgi:uncharacterized protein (TIGR02145 family)